MHPWPEMDPHWHAEGTTLAGTRPAASAAGSMMGMSGGLLLFEQILDPPARLGEVHAAGVALFERAHHLAHLPEAGGTYLLEGGRDRRLRLSLAHLLGQERLDDGDLGRFLVGQRLPAGLLVDGERLAPLLDHFLKQRRDLRVWDRRPGSDVGLLQGGADEPQRGKARLVLRLEGSLHLSHQPFAHRTLLPCLMYAGPHPTTSSVDPVGRFAY